MCSIFGYLRRGPSTPEREAFHLISLIRASQQRGRDGVGYSACGVFEDRVHLYSDKKVGEDALAAHEMRDKLIATMAQSQQGVALIGNCRAEPTTEYVKDKKAQDQQPYNLDDWSIVHNGTIANDKELRTDVLPTSIDSAAIVEQLAEVSRLNPDLHAREVFESIVTGLEGSFAILASHRKHPNVLLYACNYRPIYFGKGAVGTMFVGSTESILAEAGIVSRAVEQYTYGYISVDGGAYVEGYLRPAMDVDRKPRALVVLSGGLDSTVAATDCVRKGMDVEAIHFQYGSRAEGPEVEAVKAVCETLGIPYRFMDVPIYKPEHSPLLQKDSVIAGGEAGAEFAHEWVPARNLVMLSIATAMAEAEGFDYIVLGNNLEEAGAYPDNEPEFIYRFNNLLDFAVADGKRVRVLMPVGNKMKHEIVAMGHALQAPMDKTWSCYRAGAKHCGKCGPCYMRKTSFEINGLPEVITYEGE